MLITNKYWNELILDLTGILRITVKWPNYQNVLRQQFRQHTMAGFFYQIDIWESLIMLKKS